MKALTCELCGGNDLVKQDGLFVCQHCGTKYSLEDARNLLIDVNVNINGAVEVQGITTKENLLKRAKSFERSGEIEKAIEYYDRVLDIDIDDPEANSALSRLKSTRKNAQKITSTVRDTSTVDAEIIRFTNNTNKKNKYTVTYVQNYNTTTDTSKGTKGCLHFIIWSQIYFWIPIIFSMPSKDSSRSSGSPETGMIYFFWILMVTVLYFSIRSIRKHYKR